MPSTLKSFDTIQSPERTVSEFDKAWAELTWRKSFVKQERMVKDLHDFAAYVRARGEHYRALGAMTKIKVLDQFIDFGADGNWASPNSQHAQEIIGLKNGFAVYAPLAYMHNVAPNARCTKDFSLGMGMFSAEVMAASGSDFILEINDSGLFMVKPDGQAGWQRTVSWATVLEYFEPIRPPVPLDGSPWEIMDRIGVYEVLACLACDYGLYGIYGRLTYDLKLSVSDSHQHVDGLEEWQQELYRALEPRAEVTGPYDKFLKKAR